MMMVLSVGEAKREVRGGGECHFRDRSPLPTPGLSFSSPMGMAGGLPKKRG